MSVGSMGSWLVRLLAFVNNISITLSIGTLCPLYVLVYMAVVSIFRARLKLMVSQIPISS